MAIMKLFDKITLEVFLTTIHLFRFVRNIIKKKKQKSEPPDSFAIKHIIKFKVSLASSLDSKHKETSCRKKKASALIPFLTQPLHNSLTEQGAGSGPCPASYLPWALLSLSSGTLFEHLHSLIQKFAMETP